MENKWSHKHLETLVFIEINIWMPVMSCSFCVLGKRLLKDIALDDCNKTYMGAMYKSFCNETTKVCDEYYLGKCAVFGTWYLLLGIQWWHWWHWAIVQIVVMSLLSWIWINFGIFFSSLVLMMMMHACQSIHRIECSEQCVDCERYQGLS